MQIGYRGSVNRWECDENDHLNVRFYVQKHWQAACCGLQAMGLEVEANPQVQHIRFLAESRIATPLTGFWGIVENPSGEGCVLVTELRHSFTDECMSAALHQLPLPGVMATDTLSESAVPRGIEPRDFDFVRIPYSDLPDHGLTLIGCGVVGEEETTADQYLVLHQYMGRLSDSMPHLWGALASAGAGLPVGQGGAVLEYRLRYHKPLKLGDRFEVWSGVAESQPKVQRFAHLMLDPIDGHLIASAEAIGVRMDLHARKAVTLSEEQQRALQSKLIRLP